MYKAQTLWPEQRSSNRARLRKQGTTRKPLLAPQLTTRALQRVKEVAILPKRFFKNTGIIELFHILPPFSYMHMPHPQVADESSSSHDGAPLVSLGSIIRGMFNMVKSQVAADNVVKSKVRVSKFAI